jgi:hypothetical protein
MSEPEKQATTGASGSGMPYETTLSDVVKGLYKDPILLFGIGAGILLVAVLAVTTSLAVVLVVAGLFVVVILVGAHQRARRRAREADVSGQAIGSRVQGSQVAKAQKGFVGRLRGRVFFSSVKDSQVGVVGDSEPPRPPSDG